MTPIATRALRPSSAAGPLPRLTEPRVRVMLIHQSSIVQNALPAHRRLLTLQRPQSEGQPKDIDRNLVSEWQHSALAQIRFRDPFTGIPIVDATGKARVDYENRSRWADTHCSTVWAGRPVTRSTSPVARLYRSSRCNCAIVEICCAT